MYLYIKRTWLRIIHQTSVLCIIHHTDATVHYTPNGRCSLLSIDRIPLLRLFSLSKSDSLIEIIYSCILHVLQNKGVCNWIVLLTYLWWKIFLYNWGVLLIAVSVGFSSYYFLFKKEWRINVQIYWSCSGK